MALSLWCSRKCVLHTNMCAQRQRLERRLCLGFLLLAQRFMVDESCGESLRLNYTDREHQIQEKKKFPGPGENDRLGTERQKKYGSSVC